MADDSTELPIKLGIEPLVEAVWEFRFLPEHSASGAVIFGKLLAEFGAGSTPEQLPVSQIPLGVREQDQNLRYATTLRFQAGPLVYMSGERAIVLSSPKPYVGWAKFREVAESVAKSARSVGAIRGPERMSLKYTNVILLDEHPSLERLNFVVRMGSLTLRAEPFLLRTEIHRRNVVHIIQIGLPAQANSPAGPTKPGLLVDIDSIMDVSQVGGEFWHKLGDTLEVAHKEGKELFFSLLTEKTLAELKPEYGK